MLPGAARRPSRSAGFGVRVSWPGSAAGGDFIVVILTTMILLRVVMRPEAARGV